jgi:uncharacterized DUF497 family protein
MVSDGFEWDDTKEAENVRAHGGIDFFEASTVFDDPGMVSVSDDDHSDEEERWTAVGGSIYGRPLRVTYTYRGDLVRIISARTLIRSQQRGFRDGTYP